MGSSEHRLPAAERRVDALWLPTPWPASSTASSAHTAAPPLSSPGPDFTSLKPLSLHTVAVSLHPRQRRASPEPQSCQRGQPLVPGAILCPGLGDDDVVPESGVRRSGDRSSGPSGSILPSTPFRSQASLKGSGHRATCLNLSMGLKAPLPWAGGLPGGSANAISGPLGSGPQGPGQTAGQAAVGPFGQLLLGCAPSHLPML